MRWTEAQLKLFTTRRSADGLTTTAHVRPTAKRKRRPARSDATEHQVHVAVVGHLRTRCRPGVSWWHHPAGEHRHPSVARKLKAMGARPGVPDLLLLIDGCLATVFVDALGRDADERGCWIREPINGDAWEWCMLAYWSHPKPRFTWTQGGFVPINFPKGRAAILKYSHTAEERRNAAS